MSTPSLKEAVFNVCQILDTRKKLTFSEKVSHVTRDLEFIATSFNTTPKAATVLSYLFDLQFRKGNGQDPEEIMRSLQLNTWEWIEIMDDLDQLVVRGIIMSRSHTFRSKTYHLSPAVIKAILSNIPFKETELTGLSEKKFFKQLSKYVSGFSDGAFNLRELIQRLDNLVQLNPELNYPILLKESFFTPLQRLFLHVLVAKTFNNELLDLREFNKEFDKEDLEFESGPEVDELEDMDKFIGEFRRGEHPLLVNKIVKLKRSNQFSGTYLYEFDEKIEKQLFGEVLLMSQGAESAFFTITAPSDITPVELYYDTTTREELDGLHDLLQDYHGVFKRQQEMDVKPQLVVMLQGAPGTGKTCFTNQLCVKLNRPLYTLNLDAVRDSYFSESEKKTKQLFVEIKKVVRDHVKRGEFSSLPIFVLNEADGILFANRSLLNGTSSTDNTVGNITSIVLTELEELEPGTVLFVTSNVAASGKLDDALARRFTHKIIIEVPKDADTRLAIIKSVFKDKISEQLAEELAHAYAVTGANISNVYRRFVNHYILKSVYPDKEQICQWFDSESAGWKTSRSIGFR